LELGFHCTPTHGVSTTPGAGFLLEVQLSWPARASMFTLNRAAATGKQWVQALSNYSLFEVAYAALVASGDPHDKKAVADALFKVNIEALAGQLNWT